MTFGLPIEMLGPKCEECCFRHEPSEPHRRMLTSDDLARLREDWKRGIFPDKKVGR